MGEFGYLDIEDNSAHYESLINTIIVPRNLKQLHKKLPKSKKYDVKSCNDLDNMDLEEKAQKNMFKKQPSI